jgi:hypothetical protein
VRLDDNETRISGARRADATGVGAWVPSCRAVLAKIRNERFAKLVTGSFWPAAVYAIPRYKAALRILLRFGPIFAFFKLRHGTRTPRGSFDLSQFPASRPFCPQLSPVSIVVRRKPAGLVAIFLRLGRTTRAHSDRASLASLAPRCTSLTPAFHYMPGKISSKF